MIWVLSIVFVLATLMLGLLIWYPYFIQVKTFKEALKENFTNGGFIVIFVMWTILISNIVSIATNNHMVTMYYVGFLTVLYFSMYPIDWIRTWLKERSKKDDC